MAKREHVGPTFNLIKKIKKKITKPKQMNQFSWQNVSDFFFKFFSFKTSLFDSRSSDRRISSGQTRKVLYETRATHENQKHGISPRIQVKIQKNPNF